MSVRSFVVVAVTALAVLSVSSVPAPAAGEEACKSSWQACRFREGPAPVNTAGCDNALTACIKNHLRQARPPLPEAQIETLALSKAQAIKAQGGGATVRPGAMPPKPRP